MFNSGAKYFATCTDDAAVGIRPWVNPGNASASDANDTTVTLSLNDTHYLKCLNGSFNIPTNATISGIIVEIEVKDTTSGITDKVVSLVKGGTVAGDNKANLTTWTAAYTILTYGSSTDLWGNTFTPSDINAANFGVVLQAEDTTGGFSTAQVDFVRATVYYTLPPTSQGYIIH